MIFHGGNGMDHEEKAAELFEAGYNCSQSVAGAFAEELGFSEKQIMTVIAGLGGGVGRMREVCGAVSGMAVVLSMKEGGYDVNDQEGKHKLYGDIQAVADRFKEENGAIRCSELLGIERDGSMPSKRDAAFHKRPCKEYVRCAAKILEEYLES